MRAKRAGRLTDVPTSPEECAIERQLSNRIPGYSAATETGSPYGRSGLLGSRFIQRPHSW